MTKCFLAGVGCGMILLACKGESSGQTKPAADDDNPTAYAALRIVSKTLGHDALERVVEVTGHDGVPQPYLWKVILKEGTGSREIDVTGGKIGAQRQLTRPPTVETPIRFADLNLDSSGAFDATDTAARKVKLRYDSLDYTLRVNPDSGKPVWHLDLIDKGGSQIGSIHLAAHDGTILSTDGRLANNPPLSPPPVTVHHAVPSPTLRPVDRPPSTLHEDAMVSATPAHRMPPRSTTTTVTTTTQDIPVATLSDQEDDRVPPNAPLPPEEGGLFTRTGRTLDRTSHTVEHSFRKAGASVQRFFTGHSDLDQEDRRDDR